MPVPRLTETTKRRTMLEVVNNPPDRRPDQPLSLYHFERLERQGRAALDAAGRVVLLAVPPPAPAPGLPALASSSPSTALVQTSAEHSFLALSCRGYDLASGAGVCTRSQLAGIPVVLASVALGCGHRSAGPIPEEVLLGFHYDGPY